MSDLSERLTDAIEDEVKQRSVEIRFNTLASLDRLTNNRVRWRVDMVNGKPMVMASLYEVFYAVVPQDE
jgi:hypothetical protein